MVPRRAAETQTAETVLMGTALDEDFRQIFESYYRSITGFFQARGFSWEESQDLTQETFYRVYRGMEGYRQESSAKTWLFTIATNLYRNEIRSRRAEKRAADEVSLEEALEQGRPVFGKRASGSGNPGDDPLTELLGAERARLLREAIEELPPRMRRCVLLRLDQGLKVREIATIANVSVETVKAQLFQARRKLSERLGQFFTGFDF